jgi:phosphoglucosamine mutase
VFHELGAQVHRIGCAPDGFNINAGFGATAPGALVEAVRAQQADYGVALDGDADRLLLVDKQGTVFDGDQLLYVMALDRVRQGKAPPGVVGTLMTNMAVEQALSRQGIELVRAKVGDRYVLEELGRRGWLLGGEGSGHLLALDCHSTGDGLVSALQVLQAVIRQGRDLHAILQDVQLFPQVLINVRLAPGTDWSASPRLKDTRAEVEQRLAGRGRILLRASGTEPVVRVMVEASEQELARSCAEQLAAALTAA